MFEEQGVVKQPFYGGFGLIAAGRIPKAAFHAFALLHKLGTERIPADSDSAIATRRSDGSLAIAVWNYAPPGAGGAPKETTLAIAGLKAGRRARISVVDREHGSALTAWEAMDRPAFPTLEQQRKLREAAKLPPAVIFSLGGREPGILTLTLAPQALALIEVIQ